MRTPTHNGVATASAVVAAQAPERALRDLLKPGQRRIHFKRDSRRRQTLSRMCALNVRMSVWDVQQRSENEVRPLSPGARCGGRPRWGRATDHRTRRFSATCRSASDRQSDPVSLGHQGCSVGMSLHTSIRCPWGSDAVAWCYSNGAIGYVASARLSSPGSPGCRNT